MTRSSGRRNERRTGRKKGRNERPNVIQNEQVKTRRRKGSGKKRKEGLKQHDFKERVRGKQRKITDNHACLDFS